MKLAANFVALASAAEGWLWNSVECPETRIKQDFDMSQYIGRWHESYRSIGIPFEKGQCVTADYSMRDDGLVRVLNSEQV